MGVAAPRLLQGAPRDLPVLLMLTGLPGSAQDWVTAGQVVPLADAWARDHGGSAPVMIFVDENGRGGRDTECVNGPRGRPKATWPMTYPFGSTKPLESASIRPGGVWWASRRGYRVAIGLAIENPRVFGSFVDVAGEPAPSHGDPKPLSGTSMGETRWRLEIRAQPDPGRGRFPHLEGWFAAGTGDRAGLGSVARHLALLAGRAGIVVHTYQGPGGHTWAFARQSFARIYPSLVRDLSGQDTIPAAGTWR